MFDRELAIQNIIDDDINRIITDYNEMGDCSVLAFILESGFKGYINYSDDMLLKEIRERELV